MKISCLVLVLADVSCSTDGLSTVTWDLGPGSGPFLLLHSRRVEVVQWLYVSTHFAAASKDIHVPELELRAATARNLASIAYNTTSLRKGVRISQVSSHGLKSIFNPKNDGRGSERVAHIPFYDMHGHYRHYGGYQKRFLLTYLTYAGYTPYTATFVRNGKHVGASLSDSCIRKVRSRRVHRCLRNHLSVTSGYISCYIVCIAIW